MPLGQAERRLPRGLTARRIGTRNRNHRAPHERSRRGTPANRIRDGGGKRSAVRALALQAGLGAALAQGAIPRDATPARIRRLRRRGRNRRQRLTEGEASPDPSPRAEGNLRLSMPALSFAAFSTSCASNCPIDLGLNLRNAKNAVFRSMKF